MSTSKANRWIWIDLEMTGLNPDRDRIIEIATIVTDTELNIVAEGPVFAVSQTQAQLDQMDQWCTDTHTKSGLVARVKQSQVDEKEAELKTLDFLREHVDENTSPMCGNSVWQDRRFLAKYMPKLEQFFHYRMLDVSTLKILAQNWEPIIYSGFNKESKHLALDDIKESIEELKYYRTHLL